MRLSRGRVPGRVGCGSLVASLLFVATAVADPLDPAEHLGYWIDEGTTPPAVAYVWPVDRVFLQHDALPLDDSQPATALAVSGSLSLHAARAYARITLVDSDLRERLVVELYPLMTGARELALEGVCRETCLLPNVVPHRLRIEVVEATLNLDRLDLLGPATAAVPDLVQRQERIRDAQAGAIVRRINEQIALHDLGWQAGATDYAALSFMDRKARSPTGQVAVMHGYEYYVAGVFSLPEEPDEGGGRRRRTAIRLAQPPRRGPTRITLLRRSVRPQRVAHADHGTGLRRLLDPRASRPARRPGEPVPASAP